MKLLAFDTSTEACSVAININGVIHQQYQLAPREHSRLILGMIEGVISEAGIKKNELDAIAFGRGPGSFMGLRIAAGVTQGIAFALDLPVVPVSTLAAIAQLTMEATGCEKVLSAIDARMAEVYWAAYYMNDKKELCLQGEEQVIAPDSIPVPDSSDWMGAGSGWHTYREVLTERLGPTLNSSIEDCFPTAKAISQLAMHSLEKGSTVSAAQAVPVYIRDNVAKKSAQQG